MARQQLRMMAALAVVFLLCSTAFADSNIATQTATTGSTTTPAATGAVATPAVAATPASTTTSDTSASAPAATQPPAVTAPVATPVSSTPAAAPVAATPVPANTVPVAAIPTPVAATPATPVAATPATPVAATPAPAVVAPVAIPSPSPAPDPCKAVPGCTACVEKTPASAGRRLLQDAGSSILTGTTSAGKPTINFEALIKSPYDDPMLPYCTACTGKGYIQGTSGKCNCLPGYGDMNPTGTCNACPDGYISMGGFRALCQECTNVAWSNDDHTSCICASGWYGYTNVATRQASCNQCPGTRPVSKDGARSAAECFACPLGSKPNEIFSECVAATPSPPPPPMTLADLLGQNTPPSPPPAPPAPAVFNSSTFATAKQDWAFQTRATGNNTNPITDLISGVVDSMVMGKPISSSAAQPGDLIYQVLTKQAPAAPKVPELPNLDNLAQLGAGLSAGLGALPGLVNAAGSGSTSTNNLVDLVGGVLKQVGAAAAQAPATPVAATPSGSNAGLANFLSGFLKAAAPATPAAAKVPIPTPISITPITPTSSVLANVAKTASGFVRVPGAPPKGTTLRLFSSKSNKAKAIKI